jgi:hypothetical protein
VDRRSGKSIVKTPTHNLSLLFGGTGVINPEIVGIFNIGKSEFLRSKESGHHKSQNPGEIGTVHQRRTCGNNRSHRRKSQQEVIDRRFGHRHIRDFVDTKPLHSESRTPKPRKEEGAIVGGQLSIEQRRKKASSCGASWKPIGI